MFNLALYRHIRQLYQPASSVFPSRERNRVCHGRAAQRVNSLPVCPVAVKSMHNRAAVLVYESAGSDERTAARVPAAEAPQTSHRPATDQPQTSHRPPELVTSRDRKLLGRRRRRAREHLEGRTTDDCRARNRIGSAEIWMSDSLYSSSC